jgi:hypothetical protein
MATPDVTAGEIMNSAAALLNDTAKDVYTFTVQLPYLQIALKELRELFELSNAPVTNETSAVIPVDSGTTVIGFNTTPALPSNLVEIQQLWERQRNSDPFIPMTKKEYLPHYLEGQETNRFLIWAWIANEIRLLPADGDNDLKIDYIRTLFTAVTDQNSIIGVINAESFLHFRTAALIAQFIMENKARADELNGNALLAIDRVTGIESKAKQAITTRHRPFRAGFKSRGLW